MAVNLAQSSVELAELLEQRTQELSESAAQQTATREILRVIATSPTDLQAVLNAVAENAARLCEASDALIYRVDNDSLKNVANFGILPGQPGVGPPSIDRRSIPGRAVIDRQTIHIHDLAVVPEDDLPARFARSVGTRTVLATPIFRDGTPIGVIQIRRTELRPFTDKQIALLKAFADQAVIAIENVRLFQELESGNQELTDSLAQQTAMSEILRVIASSPKDLHPVLNTVAENAARVCSASDALIFLIENGFLRHSARFGSVMTSKGIGEIGPPIDRGSVPGRAVIDQQTIHVHDLPAVADEFPLAKTRGIVQGNRTSLATPLIRQGVSIGVILIRRLEVQPFSEKQIALLKTFADQAVIAIENVRLFQELEARNRDLIESLAQQVATSEILRVIASSPTELKPVLDALAESAARVCGASDALIFFVEDGFLRHAAKYGSILTAQQPGEIGPTVNRDSVPGRAVVECQPIHVHDLRAVADEFPMAKTRGIAQRVRTSLATPLLRQGMPIGVILIRREEVNPFSDKQIALLNTFADQAVIAIENIRLFQEIQEKSRQVEAANERLEELDRLKSDFVSNVSHELRTPLTAIKGAVDLVLREVAGPLTEKQIHYLTRIRSNTQHLAGLINDLLDLSKIESGKIEVKASRISLAGLVHEVVETLRPVAAEKVIALEASILEPSILVWADRDKVNQILMNLIGNAIKFTPAQGGVTVSVVKSGNESVRVSVSDSGPGIPPQEKENIFDKFYQIAQVGETKPRGTGLGLAICKALVELHGGRIWVETTENRGSTFCFTLPVSGLRNFPVKANGEAA